jgi:hypothetical protein
MGFADALVQPLHDTVDLLERNRGVGRHAFAISVAFDHWKCCGKLCIQLPG